MNQFNIINNLLVVLILSHILSNPFVETIVLSHESIHFIALRELRFILTQNNINIQSKNNKAFLAQQFLQLLQNHTITPPTPTQSNQQSQPPPKQPLLSVPVLSLLI